MHGNREASNPSFLRLLSSISRKQLNLLMTERRCVPGEVVYREGDAGDNLYMIWSGQVVAFMGQPDSPTILGYRGAGETIGEMSLLDNQPRSAWVVALTDLRLLKITREAFYQLLQQEPSLGMSIMEALSSRLRGSDQERSLGKTSERRLISQLSELETQKQQLLELQQVRQETSDLIIHDLRNPLGSIQLSISMLEMVLPEEVLQENAQLLEIARNSCNRMLRLVEFAAGCFAHGIGRGAALLCPAGSAHAAAQRRGQLAGGARSRHPDGGRSARGAPHRQRRPG